MQSAQPQEEARTPAAGCSASVLMALAVIQYAVVACAVLMALDKGEHAFIPLMIAGFPCSTVVAYVIAGTGLPAAITFVILILCALISPTGLLVLSRRLRTPPLPPA